MEYTHIRDYDDYWLFEGYAGHSQIRRVYSSATGDLARHVPILLLISYSILTQDDTSLL